MGYNEEKQRQLDMRYLRMARIWAENSYCVRRKVGALIVKDKMIISDGYNGTPSGFENVCEDENGKTKPYVLHAEANAITKVAKSATTATARRSTSPRRPASNVRNSSSRQVSSEWFTARSTARKRGSTCCARSASNAYSAKSTNADIRPVKRIPLLLTTLPCISGGLISSRGQEPSAQHPASIEALNYMVGRGW